MIEVEVKIPDSLQRKLDPERYNRALGSATMALGEQLRGYLARYPGPAHKPVIWASAKQRRFYFAMRRERGLPPRYSRQSDPMSQRLLVGWSVKRHGTTGAIVGTRGIKYARYVQSAQYQTAQHRATGWVTDRQAVDKLKKSGAIQRITRAAVAKVTGE
jgi:hypothetical protein